MFCDLCDSLSALCDNIFLLRPFPYPMNYETVIGLEVHVQIKTASKMFTRVAAGYGQPENTLTNPVVLLLLLQALSSRGVAGR